MKKLFTFFVSALAIQCVMALDPATNLDTYYSSVQKKSGDNIVTTLQDIIDNHTVIGYSSLEPYYEQTDFENGQILDMYSTCKFDMRDANCSQKNVCDCWNKEHSVPQSWFNEATPMKSDLFHVYPTDARVNNFRSNYPYGETSSTAYIDNNKNALGRLGSSSFSGYSGKVYEPDDQYKGDFARTYMYMVTRYADKNFTQSAEGKVMFTYSGGRAYLSDYSVALLMKWHREDPVSEKEVKRNNAVYGIQKNRNPFIDYPYLAEYIWGKMKGETVDFNKMISAYDPNFVWGVSDGSQAVTDPTIVPSMDKIDFLPILAGEQSIRPMSIVGLNLTGEIRLNVVGDGFSVAPTTIAASGANGTNNINVTFAPTHAGNYSGTLSISSNGAATVNVALSGVCAASHTILWLVNGHEYTEGEPTTVVVEGNYPTVLPTAPKTCDEISSQFVGWSRQEISGTTDVMPSDLFAYEDEAPKIMSDTRFYAVFAKMDGTADEEVSIVMKDRTDITGNVEVAGRTINIDDHVSFVCEGGGTPAKYYPTGEAIRVYGGGKMTVNADAPMTKIEITYEKYKSENELSANVGTWSSPMWRGEAETVVFTVGGSSGHAKIKAMTVTYGGGVSYSRYITSWSCGTTAIEAVAEDVIPTGPVAVYTVMGQYMGTMLMEDVTNTLPSGFYIVHAANCTLKLSIL